ncbi:MAG: hypothetical protein ACP5GI_06200 [Sulfolobales archaeon]
MKLYNRSNNLVISRIILFSLLSIVIMILLFNNGTIYSQTTQPSSSENITITYTYPINITTVSITQTVYPETTILQTTIYTVSAQNTTFMNTTITTNITTIYFKELPTYTYTEYKVLSITTTRPPEATERATWISAGVFVGVLAGLTIGYAYYAKGVSVRPPKKR